MAQLSGGGDCRVLAGKMNEPICSFSAGQDCAACWRGMVKRCIIVVLEGTIKSRGGHACTGEVKSEMLEHRGCKISPGVDWHGQQETVDGLRWRVCQRWSQKRQRRGTKRLLGWFG